MKEKHTYEIGEKLNFLCKQEYDDSPKIIDIDPVSYISDLLIQFSKYITKGQGLSKKGVNSLLLTVLTSGLLYVNTTFPKTTGEFLKLYIIPVLFLFFFIIDFLKSINPVNRFFKRIFQRTEFIYYEILSGRVSLNDLGFNINIISFEKNKLEGIIDYLTKNDQFTPKIQISLLSNTSIYRLDTLPMIKERMLRMNWESSAVCTFLKNTALNLSEGYLDKLIEKYNEKPSIKFAVGHFHGYDKGSDIYYKLGKQFEFKNPLFKFSKFLVLMSGIVLITIIFVVILYTLLKLSISNMVFPIYQGIVYVFALAIISTIVISNFNSYFLNRTLKKYFQNNFDVKNDFITDEIISDLTDAYDKR